MALEDDLKENTAAVKALTEIMGQMVHLMTHEKPPQPQPELKAVPTPIAIKKQPESVEKTDPTPAEKPAKRQRRVKKAEEAVTNEAKQAEQKETAPSKVPAAKKEPAPTKPTPEKESKPEPATEVAKPPTQKALREKLMRVANALGRDSARTLLEEFGATTLPKLKPENYVAAAQKCDDLIKGIESAGA